MLAARARVRNASRNAANLMLSPQAVVSCSGYNRPPKRKVEPRARAAPPPPPAAATEAGGQRSGRSRLVGPPA